MPPAPAGRSCHRAKTCALRRLRGRSCGPGGMRENVACARVPATDRRFTFAAASLPGCLLRKEVVQPLVPQRLPCYDFIPITAHTLGGCPLAVGAPPSGADGFHDVTGGVYKARERIHGAVADAPLLANPASRCRVADTDLNWGGFWGLAPPRGLASLCTRHCSTCAAPDVRAILT